MNSIKKIIILSVIIFNVSCATGKNNNKEMSLTALIKAGKNVVFEDKAFNSDWDFTAELERVAETEGMDRVYVASAITFKKCTFKGKVVAMVNGASGGGVSSYFQKNVSFINCIFEEEVNMRAATFLAVCSFQGSSFLKGANFEECTFMNDAYFNDTKYREETRFQNITAMKKSNWMKARFESNVSFQGATFYNDAQFSTAEFQKYADFTVSVFQNNCFFNYCKFGPQAIFNSSSFSHRVEMLSSSFQKIEMRTCLFVLPPKFYQNEITGTIDFSKSIFVSGLPDLSKMKRDVILAEDIKLGTEIISSAVFLTRVVTP